MCFMYIVCISLTRGHVCICYFTRATVSAEQAYSPVHVVSPVMLLCNCFMKK